MPSPELDTNTGVPIYRQIKDLLRDEILSGQIVPDRPITEAQLLERFGVSRAPIRQALNELTTEGLIYRKQGKGTFPVPGARVERPADIRAGGLYDYLEATGMKPTSTVRDLCKTSAPEHVRRELQADKDEQLLHFMRLTTSGDEPVAEVEVYIRVPDDFNPTAEELETAGSAFKLLEDRYGITLETAEHAASATAATAEQAAALQVEEGSPLLLLETVFHITGGIPTGWRSAIHPAGEFKYRFSSNT